MSGEGSSFNPRKRKIQYRGKDRRVYSRVERLVDHPVLDFEEDSEEREKLVKFVATNIVEHRTINWEWLQGMGASDRVAELLGPRLRAAMDCRWPQYTELTLEFHCTFAEKNAVSFLLGWNLYEISIAEFGVALGFYTEREVREVCTIMLGQIVWVRRSWPDSGRRLQPHCSRARTLSQRFVTRSIGIF
ncbi:hypothetical protein HanIR_Chr12g0569831 [Helianthus annuus]|nr:hypothetical protein HanIR_Chr12g0569831 [Helianthus annuus]